MHDIQIAISLHLTGKCHKIEPSFGFIGNYSFSAQALIALTIGARVSHCGCASSLLSDGYPDILVRFASAALSNLFTGGAHNWSVVPSVSQSLLGGTAPGHLAYARARKDYYAPTYPSTVQTAFRRVGCARMTGDDPSRAPGVGGPRGVVRYRLSPCRCAVSRQRRLLSEPARGPAIALRGPAGPDSDAQQRSPEPHFALSGARWRRDRRLDTVGWRRSAGHQPITATPPAAMFTPAEPRAQALVRRLFRVSLISYIHERLAAASS
jgi:hypothetical protein